MALCGLGLTALWRLAKSLSMLGDIKQTGLRNQQSLSDSRAEIKAMGERQDKNFHELGTERVEMRCKIKTLEEQVLGRSTEWETDFGDKST